MELLDIVHSETGESTGLHMPRHEALAQKAWCRSTNVFVVNSKGELLCHQRSLEKERMPGIWSTHLGGHVGAHETYQENALKELHEEAGIKKEKHELIPWRTHRAEHTPKGQHVHLWMHDFVTLHDAHVDDLVPQPGEVERFEWMSARDIMNAAEKNPELWCAGVNDFRTDFVCLCAALTAAQAAGIVQVPSPIHHWHPAVA